MDLIDEFFDYITSGLYDIDARLEQVLCKVLDDRWCCPYILLMYGQHGIIH